jgi:dihydrofolate reductase
LTKPRSISIVLVAAVADNGVIGRDNALPFRQSSDLKRFKALTMGRPVLMGRKTFLSIGKPLPGRTNIVVSRNAGFGGAGIVVAADFDFAMDVARGDALRRGVNEIAVIGGADIFTRLMPLADRLEITHVRARPEGDTHFPPIDASQWRAVEQSELPAGPRDEAPVTYVTYARA